MITINFFGDKTKIKPPKNYKNLVKLVQKNFQVSDEEIKSMLITFNDPIDNERARLLPQIYDNFLKNSDKNIYIDFIETLLKKKDDFPPQNNFNQINNNNDINFFNFNDEHLNQNDNFKKIEINEKNEEKELKDKEIEKKEEKEEKELKDTELKKKVEKELKDKEREKELDKAKSQMKQLNELFSEQEKAYKKYTENKQINQIIIENNNNQDSNLKDNIDKIISNYLNKFKNDVLQETILETKLLSQESKIQLMKNNQRKENLKNLNSNKKYDINASNRNICETIHSGIKCDGCGMYPIKGLRFKCLVCPSFNFCYNCEENEEHEHPFYKIRFPLND